jgi:hypothetical protein
MFSKLSGFLLAMDEIYCDGEKTILGDESDDDEAESFLPSRDIAGAWLVECTYGLGAGSDPNNTEMRIHMHLGGRLISRETARYQLPFLQDPDAEPLKMFREQMQDALMMGAVQAATMGDTRLAAEALKLLRSDDLDFDSVIGQLVDFLQAPAPPTAQQGAGGALDAAQAAESLARGGIPGNAQNAPAPPLPELGQLMGNSSNRVI